MKDDEKKQIINYNLGYLLLTCLCLGMLGGVIISLRADNVENAGTMAGYFFDFLTFIFFIQLLFLTYKKRTYWLAQLHSDIGQAIGQVIGVAIGGSLVASLFFLGLIIGIPYMFGSFDVSGFYSHLRGVITLGSYFGLAGIVASAALLALGWLWWRQNSAAASPPNRHGPE